MLGRIILALVIMVMLASCTNNKTISNDTKEIIDTSMKFNYIIPLPYKFEEYKVKIKKVEIKIAKPPVKELFETFEVTAYTAGYESTGKRKGDPEYGVTASGNKVKENQTVACPKSMEFGTKVYIPYFDNTFICEDRGGRITEGHIDVYMRDYNKAMDFGRQKLEILIIRKDGV